jgi:hypothetical protein
MGTLSEISSHFSGTCPTSALAKAAGTVLTSRRERVPDIEVMDGHLEDELDAILRVVQQS